MTSTFSTVSLPSTLSGINDKYYGGVLAPNGKVYFAPYKETVPHVGVFDPVTRAFSTIDVVHQSEFGKWNGGVLAPNGKIYFPPRNSDWVLVLDPVTNATSVVNADPASAIKPNKFSGGVCAPNGKLIFAPANEKNVGVFDVGNAAPAYMVAGGVPEARPSLPERCASTCKNRVFHPTSPPPDLDPVWRLV